MSERNRVPKNADRPEDPREERLRSLLGAAYPPGYPAAEPSEALQRHVTELAARYRARRAAQGAANGRRRLRWELAGGALSAAVLLGYLGVALVRQGPPSTAVRSSPCPMPSRTMAQARLTSPPSPLPDTGRGSKTDRPVATPLPVSGRGARGERLTRQAELALSIGPPASPPYSRPRPTAPPSDVPSTGGRDRDSRFPSGKTEAFDFIQIPLPRVASTADRALAAAVETHQREAAVIDTRLGREITLAVKAMALSDLCSRLKEETGIRLDAGASVADEKVTLFCEKRPLREVMQQLCRPFGYTWLRTRRPALGSGLWALGSGPGTGGRLRTEGPRDSPGSSRSEPGPPLRGSPAAVRFEAKARQGPLPQSPEPRADYSYELVQDLRSQLLEEELRNRDRREALLALDREMQRYRPYLSLSPDEARARAAAVRPSGGTGSLPVSGRAGGEVAALGAKALLENLAGYGWGPVQLYFRLSPPDLARLRAGESLKFSAEPKEGEQLLPDTIGRGVLPALGDWRVRLQDGRPSGIGFAKNLPDGLPLASVPEVRVTVTLALNTRELGQSALSGSSGVRVGGMMMADGDRLAIGVSPTVRHPGNKRANAGLAGDSALRPHISFQPQPSCRPGQTNDERPRTNEEREPPDVGGRSPGAGVVVVGRRATSADVLEALHRATGMSLVADYYTRLYPVDAVSVQAATLFEALNHVSDAMHLRWQKDGAWLQFRSAGYYDDRFKEVPNRLLHRWAAARREHGALPLEDLLEIAQLTDAQLDSNDMAEGARDCFGLIEWALAQHGTLRQHAPFLAHLTPAQRQEAQGVAGLPFARMTLAQQQEFLSHVPFPKEETGVGPRALRGHPTPVGPHGESRAYSLAELVAPASLRVEYAQPGWFRWVAPDGPNDRPDRPSRQLSPIRERTREAALLAARRLDPKVPEEQILPSDLALRVQYSLGSRPTGGSTLLVSVTPSSSGATTHTFEPEGAARQPAGAP